MKANELTDGIYVYFNCFDGSKIIVKVTGFKDSVVYGISECGTHWCNIDKVEPIPITSEILEKNGFVANKHVYPYHYYEYINKEDKLKVGFEFPQGNKTIYKDPWIYIDSERVFIEHLPCVFVHELQHALRLCGIEKEIETRWRGEYLFTSKFRESAKYFFELGMSVSNKAQKGE